MSPRPQGYGLRHRRRMSCSSQSRGNPFTTVVGARLVRTFRRRSTGATARRRSTGTPDPTTGRVTGNAHVRRGGRLPRRTINWIATATARQSSSPFDVKVQDAPLTATPRSAVTAVASTQFSGPVATFTDADPPRAPRPTTRRASTGATGRIVRRHRHAQPAADLPVNGTHTYARSATYSTHRSRSLTPAAPALSPTEPQRLGPLRPR